MNISTSLIAQARKEKMLGYALLGQVRERKQ